MESVLVNKIMCFVLFFKDKMNATIYYEWVLCLASINGYKLEKQCPNFVVKFCSVDGVVVVTIIAAAKKGIRFWGIHHPSFFFVVFQTKERTWLLVGSLSTFCLDAAVASSHRLRVQEALDVFVVVALHVIFRLVQLLLVEREIAVQV